MKGDIQREKKLEKLVKKYAKIRKELKAKIVDSKLTDKERLECMFQLDLLPKNSSPVRLRNRCKITGRSRGVRFGICRFKLRELAIQGLIPGLEKATW